MARLWEIGHSEGMFRGKRRRFQTSRSRVVVILSLKMKALKPLPKSVVFAFEVYFFFYLLVAKSDFVRYCRSWESCFLTVVLCDDNL